MIVTVAWLALAAAGLTLELASRRKARITSLAVIGSAIASRRLGRLGLVAAWALVGWHLFARYTIHPL
jgi:Family of unknown function (DUF6186)